MRQEHITIDKQTVSYSVCESPQSLATIVFLHGWRQNMDSWKQVMEPLCQKGYTVYALDLPGFGESPRPHDTWGIPEYANLVQACITQLNLDQVVIVGHSFGGRIGIYLTVHMPQHVSQLVLVNSAGFKSKRNLLGTTLGFGRKILESVGLHRVATYAKKVAYTMVDASDYQASQGMQDIFRATVGFDLTKEMSQITKPTLIIHGRNDPTVSIADAQRMHTTIPQSIFKELPNVGHFAHQEKPLLVSSLIHNVITRT